MKKLMALLAAAALCVCMAGCVKEPEQTEPAGNTEPTGTAGAPANTVQMTIPSQIQDSTEGTIQVPVPDDMPDAPTADDSLPGDEMPGDQIKDTHTS